MRGLDSRTVRIMIILRTVYHTLPDAQFQQDRWGLAMSVKPPRAEVGLSRFDVRYVPLAEVAMPAEEPSTASKAEVSLSRFDVRYVPNPDIRGINA